MTKPEPQRWVSAGYVVALPFPRPAQMDAALLPPVLCTASACLADVVDSWILSWVRMEDAKRAEIAARFGIATERLPEVHAWADRHFEQGFRWPCFFEALEVAQDFCARFVPPKAGARIIGLALAAEDVGRFLEQIIPTPEASASFERRTAPPQGGIRLGSEVLGCEHGCSLHSFHCNGLARDYFERFGARLNAQGLFDDHALARRCATYTDSDECRAEPVPWFAVRLTEYPRAAQ
ncbi:hypothetical protein FGE12_29730 [Aggregicoccus sp. 17bor-14]|uniref:hypothetical protein n=1 Tax=Myxococcaceae TaxID=31 RepID=UPI00129C3B21|nr:MULTISPECIES: hypothetical protein [Myxococcaceae]MBF5046636.1 hypothetical protein [Simulacricoccus sp. 17bor-14]MRI92346.1 hypothetical protein [Aggregicoccus sp. 17bor-14]